MLKTWITGTKDFTDQGLSPSEWINDNVTIVDGGKLGKCMYFNGTSSRLSTTGYTLSNKWSWACWVKEDPSVTAWQLVLMLNTSGSDADSQTALWLKANEHRFEVCNNAKYNSTIQYSQGQWNHYAMSFDGTTTKAYLNGSQVATFTSSTIFSKTNLTIGAMGTNANGGHVSASYYLKGYINDLRIWDDEVISPLQVKHLSQGLILHYPLDNNGWGQENQFKNSNFTNGTNSWYGVNSSAIRVETIDGHLCGTGTKGTSNNIIGQTSNSYNYEGGTTIDISLSAKIYVTETGTFTVGNWISTTQIGGWQGMSGTRIWNTSNNLSVGWNYISTTLKNATNQYTGNIVTAFGFTGTTFWITDVKLEIGDHSTPWCPNSSDELATAMGLNDGIEYDCSGFGNNGEKTTTINYSSNSARYMGSYEFNSTDRSNIYFPNEANPPEEISISLWGYKNNWNAAERLAGKAASGSGWCIGDYGSENTMFGFFLQSGSGGYNTISGFRQLSSGWHHFVITFDGYNLKYYLDGECISTKTWESKQKLQVGAGKYNIGSHTNNSYFFNGNMNDFRIYATALSASDVLSLYQNSAYIDSSGNVYGAVHSEV